MTSGRVLSLLLVLVGTALPAQALDSGEVSGSLRNLSQVIASSPLLDRGMTLSATTLRLETRQSLTGSVEAEAALENLWLYTNPAGLVSPDSDPPNNQVDLTGTWREGERWSTRLHVDRLVLYGNSGPWRWAAGRQPYGFGSIVMVSPLDVIAPFPPSAIDTEYRPGIDALRIDRATSRGDLLGAVAVFDDDSGQSSYLASGSFNRKGVDLLLLAGDLRERLMGGVGLAGSLGGLGIKGELAWYDGKNVGTAGGDLYGDFPIGAVELWYRFANDLIVLAEYLYNGAGSEDPHRYLETASSAPYREGLSTLLGKNYLLLAPSYELHPLLSLALLGIWNLDDDSYLVRPQVALSLGDNLALEVSHTLNRGEKPATGPLPGTVIPRSEFGLVGDSSAIYLRWYF